LAQSTVSHIIISKQVEKTEKDADLIAARCLQAAGRSDVVQAHVAKLNAQKAEKDCFIYPSEQEQVAYLKPYTNR